MAKKVTAADVLEWIMQHWAVSLAIGGFIFMCLSFNARLGNAEEALAGKADASQVGRLENKFDRYENKFDQLTLELIGRKLEATNGNADSGTGEEDAD